MALEDFVDGVGPTVKAAWLNVVDRLKFTVFADAATKAAARTALTSDAPLEVANGGTGTRGAGASWLVWLASFFPYIYQFINPRTAAEISAGVTPTNYAYPPGDVRRYGAVADGVTDDLAAFEKAWLVMRPIGGKLVIPPGDYMLSDTWVLDINDGVSTPYPRNYCIDGFGAKLFFGGASGAAIQVVGAYNEFLTDIVGISFDHRGNADVDGCIDIRGGHCVRVSRCTVEMHSVGSEYYFVSLDTKIPGASEDGYNSFWCIVEQCSTRRRSGGESGELKYGIRMKGAVNAFIARDNVLSNCVYGVYALPADTTLTLPNAVLFDGNAFETISAAAIHVQMTPGQLGPTGWRVISNRCETTPAFFSLATGGADALPHTQPPLLFGNYCTGGSVDDWVLNPTNYPVSVMETRYPGYGPAVTNNFWNTGSFQLRFGAGGDFYLIDAAGGNDFNRAKIILGSYSLWLNNTNGILYLKDGQPANNTDGTVVGTQT